MKSRGEIILEAKAKLEDEVENLQSKVTQLGQFLDTFNLYVQTTHMYTWDHSRAHIYTYYHNDTPHLYFSPGQLKDENASMKAQLDSVSSVSPLCTEIVQYGGKLVYCGMCVSLHHHGVLCKLVETRGRRTKHSGATRAERTAGAGEAENVSTLGSVCHIENAFYFTLSTWFVGLRRERLWMLSWFSFAAGVAPMLQSLCSALQGYRKEKCESI